MSVNVNPSVGVEIIKMLMNEADQRLWKYKGREGRKKRLKQLYDLYLECRERAKTLTDEELEKIEITILNKCIPIFFLAYFGENVKNHINLVIGTYRLIFKKHIERINKKANVNKEESIKKEKKKILFCSDRLTGLSSVLRDRVNTIIKLSEMKNIFEVHCMTKPENTEDQFGKNLLSKVEKVLRFTGDIEKDIDLVIEEKYDIIIYCDCHMSEAVSCISLFRLAPFQFSTFGHSETTGTCDGYFCSKLYQEDDIQYWRHHYTETLFIQQSMGTCYGRVFDDQQTKQFGQRSKFLLPLDKKIYLTTSSLFKMGSEMFEIFNGILDKDKNSIIVITRQGTWHDEEFYKDLEKEIRPENLQKIHMIPRLNNIIDIHNLIALSDVYLESYPFGNLNSSIECFSAEPPLPVITWPTHKMNGHFTIGFYNMMDISSMQDLHAVDLNDYIRCAILIANDNDINKHIRRQIRLSRDRLFNDEKTIEEWKDILLNYCSDKQTNIEICNNKQPIFDYEN